MKRIIFPAAMIITLLFSAFLSCPLAAQDTGGSNVPEGMELRQVGGTKIIVPQGAQVSQQGGLIVVEPIDKYVARALSEMRKKLAALEKNQNGLEKQIQELKKEISRINQGETKTAPEK